MKILMLFFLLSNLACLATDEKQKIKDHLNILSVLSADHFATDPRRLDQYAKICPEFARSKYYKCVKNDFDSHPDISKKPSLWARFKFKCDLSRTVTNKQTYRDAMHIQFKCLQEIGSTDNSSN